MMIMMMAIMMTVGKWVSTVEFVRNFAQPQDTEGGIEMPVEHMTRERQRILCAERRGATDAREGQAASDEVAEECHLGI